MNKLAGLAWIFGAVVFFSACSQSPDEKKRDEILHVVGTYFDNVRRITVLYFTEGGQSDKPRDTRKAASNKIGRLHKANESLIDKSIDNTYRLKAPNLMEQVVFHVLDKDTGGITIDLGEPQIDNMLAQMPVYVNNRGCDVFLRNADHSWKIFKVECEPVY